MKITSLWLLFVPMVFVIGALDLAYEGFYGRSSYSTEAIYKVPNSSIEIVLERRGIHYFLAEYERTLALRLKKQEILREDVAVDTGGYSRMNMFQVSLSEYFLCGDMSFDRYFLNVEEASLTDASLNAKPTKAKFVGVFDRDEKRVWRFIPAYERGEQESKTCQYGGVE